MRNDIKNTLEKSEVFSKSDPNLALALERPKDPRPYLCLFEGVEISLRSAILSTNCVVVTNFDVGFRRRVLADDPVIKRSIEKTLH